jgi:geranylgeranyl reductase family protein
MDSPRKLEKYDVLVIGAGPAGSIAAQVAQDKGLSVCIIEKQALGRDGRYKACGGALAWEVVEELHYPLEKIERVIESLELHHSSGATFSKKGKGAVVWRGVFDKFLTDIARDKGVPIRDDEKLQSITRNESTNEYKIITSKGVYIAKYIIAADGVYSDTLRGLNWPNFAQEDLVLTITHEIKSNPNHIARTLGADAVHLFFGISDLIPLGYAWLFPKSDVITLGWGNNLARIKNTKAEFAKFYNLPLVQNSILNNQIQIKRGHLIPVGVRPQIFHENVFAAGDAGGFVDPISGKGIPYAMLSGKIAIESIHRAEQKGKLDQVGGIYERKLDTEFLAALKIKKQFRFKIFQNDETLLKFLSLWQNHRSSEIIAKKLF